MMFSTPPQPTAMATPPPPPHLCTRHPTFVTAPPRASTPCRSAAGRCSSCGGPTGWSWRRTGGRTVMHWCTGQLVGSWHVNGLRAPRSRRTTCHRSRTPSRRRKGDGQFEVHANVRYANKMLPNPIFLRDFCAIVLSVRTTSSVRYLLPVCKLRAMFVRFSHGFEYCNPVCSSTVTVLV